MLMGDSNANYSGEYISTLVTCQKVIAQQLAKLPLEVYLKDTEKGKVKHKQHKLYKLLHSAPNAYTTSYNFIQMMLMQMLDTGNAFAKILRDSKGNVISLEIIPNSEIKGYKITGNNLYYYRLKDGNKNGETLHNDDVIHLRFISSIGVMGINPVEVIYQELNNIWHGRTTLNSTYKNNLNIDKYISSDILNFGTKGVQEAVDNIKKEYSGSLNTRKVPVLPAGFKVNSITGGSIQDAQILESMHFSKRDISALYGVPLHFLNADGGSYASLEQNNLAFKTNTLAPISRMIKQELENKLLSDMEIDAGVSIEFNFNGNMESDMATRVNYFKSMQSMGAITANEIATLEGFETFEGGDKHYLQAQYIAVEDQNTTQENEGKENII